MHQNVTIHQIEIDIWVGKGLMIGTFTLILKALISRAYEMK